MRLIASCVTLAVSFGFAQQAPAQDHKLDRLDPETRSAVSVLIDSARLIKIPTAPLVDKALEGVAKGSDRTTIVTAVRRLSTELTQARRVLGPSSSTDELRAAATALHAGVSPLDLAKLHASAPKRALTMPLAVLTDLVTRDVPVDTASRIVVTLIKAGVHDPDLTLFQRNVRMDIERGADPTTAATTRARGIALRGASVPSRPD